jgi:hypothetical protein
MSVPGIGCSQSVAWSTMGMRRGSMITRDAPFFTARTTS